MGSGRLHKPERQAKLQKHLEEDPFLTDEDLAKLLGVSKQTIRLDRLELGVPEVRARMRKVAEDSYSKIRSISGGEVVGELIDIKPESSGISVLETTEEMGFQRTKIVRGHHIFAQANSLAVALVDAPVALTGSAKIRFKRPVYAGARLVARAKVVEKSGRRYTISVFTTDRGEEVFEGQFVVVGLEGGEQIEGRSGRDGGGLRS